MKRLCLALLMFLCASVARADDLTTRILERHVLPGYTALAAASVELAAAAEVDCRLVSKALRAAFHKAFDAWLGVSHLRFGPSEVDNRAFALAFWPDPRSKTRKALNRLIAAQDPIVVDPAAFETVSIAARGFYAMERLLFGEPSGDAETGAYRCRLTRAISRDIAATTDALNLDWQDRYAAFVRMPGTGDSPYRTENELRQEYFKALATGLQFTSEARLGRPLGTFDRPRPKRAESRLSGRSLRNVRQSLAALEVLAGLLSANQPQITGSFERAFQSAYEAADDVDDDPVFSGVTDIRGRLLVEILQQRVDAIREVVHNQLGPALGVGAGFNALDGD